MTLYTVSDAKSRARALRAECAAAGVPVSHAQALEMVAKKAGARDWNTLHARLVKQEEPLHLHDAVRGHYLGQAFTGKITVLTVRDNGFDVTIRLDRPVDTVRFDSFTNLRRQIRGTIGLHGRSAALTSDDVPQLIVEKIQLQRSG
ncbi:glyoxalase superfamily protein [Paracoccus sp. (in: a-proteobacteria)]|uniref:glyoxalase superfamily protein n=1 Tax=Paracoccus sp. TaxID=267 RepID=UPI00396C99CB